MMKQAADKLILKYIFVFTLLLTCLFTGRVQASSEIDVGLIVSQFSAEVIAPSAFVATEPDGNQTTLEKGKYFIAANSGKIMLGSHQLASGTVLEMAEPKDKEEKTNKNATTTSDKVSGKTANQKQDQNKDRTSADSSRHLFTVNRQEYRGALKIYITNEGKNLTVNLTVVNRVPLEYYVNSVLGPKSSPIWPDEAIKAQAVAVRSLAWYYKNNPESSLFAVRAVEPETFYGGIRTENKNITKVAALTAGQVLYYNGRPAAAYTCESSGGMTVSAAEVLQKDIPYLTKDRYPSGRVKIIYWQGDLGSVTLSGQELADMLALSSNWFDVYLTDPVPQKLDVPIENRYGIEIGKKQIPITIKGREKSTWQSAIPGYHFLEGTADETLLFKGKGIGRGLGLSKWGAKGMADTAPEKAKDYYKTILLHYYPGTYLVSAY